MYIDDAVTGFDQTLELEDGVHNVVEQLFEGQKKSHKLGVKLNLPLYKVKTSGTHTHKHLLSHKHNTGAISVS